MVVLIGKPSSGKGTQSHLLSEFLNYKHVSPGELLRSSKDPEIEKILQSGKLVPHNITFKLLQKNLTEKSILDGFPRDPIQLEWFEGIVKNYTVTIFEIDVSDEICMDRMLSRNRSDDHIDSIKNRLKTYNSNIDFLRFELSNNYKFHKIDGTQRKEKIFNDIVSLL